jgi:hypothetical protein
VTSFRLFIFKKLCECTVLSKSNKQKNFIFNQFFVGLLKVSDEIRIRIRIHQPDAWIFGSGSGFTPKCHGSGILHFGLYIEPAESYASFCDPVTLTDFFKKRGNYVKKGKVIGGQQDSKDQHTF